jgi:hypothetical protein
MSGIYSRQNYDECYYPILKKMTEGGIDNNINNEKIHNNYCINNILPMNSRGAYMSTLDYKNIHNLVDLESHLKNLDLPLSQQIEGRTVSERSVVLNKLSDKIVKEFCNDEEFTDINTRLDSPPIFIRESTITRFDYPIVPHTSYFYDGYDNSLQKGDNRRGINTRLMAKDSYAKENNFKNNNNNNNNNVCDN